MEENIAHAENSWPEHAADTHMTTFPLYQSGRATKDLDHTEATLWAQKFLAEDVVKLQYLKQHHYHPVNQTTGERVPLGGCQKKDRPGICKSHYPRDAWLRDDATVLCPCQLSRHGFEKQGRKNRLGALHGPYGHPYINSCHPALLAAVRGGNCDVQVPYRLPYACQSCQGTLSADARRDIVAAVQRAQDAQTGYCSDYCSKNQPMGFHKIKEFQKGHLSLQANLKSRDIKEIGKRHASRFLSDAYCKGIVRGQVECCNLRANHVEGHCCGRTGVDDILQKFSRPSLLGHVRQHAWREAMGPENKVCENTTSTRHGGTASARGRDGASVRSPADSI